MTTVGDVATRDTPFRVHLAPDLNTLSVQLGDAAKAIALVKELPKRNSPHLAFSSSIKLFSDGAFFGQAMQIEAPGSKDGHHGDWIMEPERLRTAMKVWWDQGYTIHTIAMAAGV